SLREGQAAGHHQGAEEWQRPQPFIPIGDLHDLAWGWRFGRRHPRARLNRGLLIRTDREFPVRLQGWGLGVEVQHRRGFFDKLRIGGGLPGVIAPGLNLVRAQPAANRARRDALDNLLLHRHLGQFLARPALPGFAVLPGGTAGQSSNLGPLQRREGIPRPRPGRIAQAVRSLPALPPALDRVHATPYALSDGGILPLRMAVRQQEDLRPLHGGERGHIAGTKVLQPRLLLRRQRDRILGSRTWHCDCPSNSAKVGQTVVCPVFAPCKPPLYFVRCVLSPAATAVAGRVSTLRAHHRTAPKTLGYLMSCSLKSLS